MKEIVFEMANKLAYMKQSPVGPWIRGSIGNIWKLLIRLKLCNYFQGDVRMIFYCPEVSFSVEKPDGTVGVIKVDVDASGGMP